MRLRSPAGTGATRLVLFALGAAVLTVAAVLSAGCSSAKHHRVLSLFFDGVPEPLAVVASADPVVQASVGRRLVRPGEHGPYAAKLCDSCHDSKATNALVAPVEQLCIRCHELGETRTYVHGPLASGGCTVCHDPHRSANRFLLVSASDGFCMHCHDRAGLSALQGEGGVDGHAGDATDCTDCHEAHMSDRQYLLR
jgi:predicted CXXCH cytochrome family protein